MDLRYGLNPEQAATARALHGDGPFRVLAGAPSYVNCLDALAGWQLVLEASAAVGGPAAASIKHVSPAGAAVDGALDAVMEDTWGVRGAELSAVARAYVRARDCDPRSSFGDFVAVSEPVDATLAGLLASVISDGIIAPGYDDGAVGVLAAKKRSTYLVLEGDVTCAPPAWEHREVLGLQLSQETARAPISRELVRSSAERPLAPTAVDDLCLAMVIARHTQSNAVTYVKDGMAIGIGAGQQSRVDCTRLAGAKADTWWLRRHPAVQGLRFDPTFRRQERLNARFRYIEDDLAPADGIAWLAQLGDVALASDGSIPFRDNVDHAARHGVRYIAEPGGAARGDEVVQACAEHGIELVRTGVRLFTH